MAGVAFLGTALVMVMFGAAAMAYVVRDSNRRRSAARAVPRQEGAGVRMPGAIAARAVDPIDDDGADEDLPTQYAVIDSEPSAHEAKSSRWVTEQVLWQDSAPSLLVTA